MSRLVGNKEGPRPWAAGNPLLRCCVPEFLSSAQTEAAAGEDVRTQSTQNALEQQY